MGKTTVSAVWSELLARQGRDILAVDADPDANLAAAFGISGQLSPEPLIEMSHLIEQRTGAKPGSVGGYFKLNPQVSDLPEKYWREVRGVKLLVLGGPSRAGAGCACPEGAFLKAFLTHSILQRREVIVVDLAAGVEFMGRASVQGIDAMAVVAEPAGRSIDSAAKIARMAGEMGIKQICAIANKATDADEVEAIKAGMGEIPVVCSVPYTAALRQADLRSEPAFEASVEVVKELSEGLHGLLGLIGSEVSSGQ